MPGAMDEAATFDPLGIIRVLNEHQVDFIVIGGFAAGVQGAQWLTFDIDITYARDRPNLTRLASALGALQAEPVELPADVQVTLDARALAAGDLWTLTTRLGRLDLLGEPASGLTYRTLLPGSRLVHGRESYRVASIEDLVAMKRAAGRPKDVGHLEILRMVAEEIDEHPRNGTA